MSCNQAYLLSGMGDTPPNFEPNGQIYSTEDHEMEQLVKALRDHTKPESRAIRAVEYVTMSEVERYPDGGAATRRDESTPSAPSRRANSPLIRPLPGSKRRSRRNRRSHSSGNQDSSARFPQESVRRLQSWVSDHVKDPYPGKEQKIVLAAQSNLSVKQVERWLVRHRTFTRKRMPTEALTDSGPSTIRGGLPAGPKAGEGLSSSREAWSRSLETYLATNPRDEGSPRLTYDSLQREITPPLFSLYRQDQRQRGKPLIQSEHAPQRQGKKIYQCYSCNRGFEFPYDWARHEKEMHDPQEIHICMRYGEKLDNQGMETCPFCGISDPTDDHLTSVHKTKQCLEKGRSVFKRSKQLLSHMKTVHNANKSMEKPPDSWTVAVGENALQHYWCGFCSQFLRVTWQDRVAHIQKHYREDNCDKTMWAPELPYTMPGPDDFELRTHRDPPMNPCPSMDPGIPKVDGLHSPIDTDLSLSYDSFAGLALDVGLSTDSGNPIDPARPVDSNPPISFDFSMEFSQIEDNDSG